MTGYRCFQTRRGISRSGQSTLEYGVLIFIVAMALTLMYTYVRRAIQANLKNLELELNARR